MSDRAPQPGRAEPLVDRSNRITGTGRLIILAFGLVGVSIGLTLMSPNQAQPFVLGLLAILAVIGVITLLAGAIGLVRFGGPGVGDDLGKMFADAMAEGVLITSRDGGIVYANRAYADLIGATEASEARTLERVMVGNPEAAEALYRIAQELREGRPATEEVRMLAPLSGGEGEGAHWYRIAARPLPAANKRKALTAWTLTDISTERARQEAMFQQLQHAIDYLDHAPAGFFSAEPDGRIVYMNATLAEWLGVDLARFEAGALRLADIVQGDGIALLAAPPADDEMRNRTALIDLDLMRTNGQSLPVRLLHRVPVTVDGAPGATRTVVLNRSPGEEGSEALRAAEVRFARFFNNTPIAIAAIDRQGRIGRTNAPFLRMFPGVRPDATRALTDLVADQDMPNLSAALASAAEGAGVVPAIDATLAGEGQRSGRFFINPVAEGAGGSEMVIVNVLDITEQRALEHQVRQQQKMELVGQLAGGIAHDFNNVLTAIIGFSDLLLANHRPSDPSFQDIMNIKQNANRAAGLVRQLLAFSRRQTLRPQVLKLSDTLSDLSMLLQRLLGESVKLELVHGRDLWPVKFDLNQFEQVIVNLAVNGRDAMPKGGTMTIRTRNLPAAEVAAFGYSPLPQVDYVMIEVSRHRQRHEPGGAGQDLRALLLDQGRRQGHGARPLHRLRHRQADRRPRLLHQRGRQGHDLPHLRAAPHSGRGRDAGRRGAGCRRDHRPHRHRLDPLGRGRGGGARVCRPCAHLARLQGGRGGVGHRGAGGDERAWRRYRSGRLGRCHARARRPLALARAAQDAAGPQDHLRLRLCRGGVRQEPARGREVPLPAQALLAQAACRGGERDAGEVGVRAIPEMDGRRILVQICLRILSTPFAQRSRRA